MAWKKGQSGNPNGRPKSSRQKLSEAFLRDLQEKWKEHGESVLDRVIKENPAKLLECITKVMPKQIEAEITHAYRASDLADDELASIAAGSGEGTADTKGGEEKLH